MSKLPKKGQVAPGNLIVLGSKTKNRPITTTLANTKRPKTDERLSPTSFISAIDSNKNENGNTESMIINFLSSIKSSLIISSKNGKVIPSHGLALFIVCKKSPTIFTKPAIMECLCSILSYTGKDSSSISTHTSSFKPQSSTAGPSPAAKLKQLQIIVSIIIFQCLKDSIKWPISLVKAYLDDSFCERNWVDLPECNILVQNIETAFPTPKIDPRQFHPLQSPSESLIHLIESSKMESGSSSSESFNFLTTGMDSNQYIRQRYEHSRSSVIEMVNSFLKDMLDKRYMHDTQTRSVIRTFSSLAGMPEVRASVINKLDCWISSKFQSVALTLLNIMTSSCYQNIAQNQHDINFCTHILLKIKFKLYKPNVQMALCDGLRKLVESNSANLKYMLTIFFNNELYNQPVIGSITSVPINQMVNKSAFVSYTFPVLYYTNPLETNKILCDLIHETMCNGAIDFKQVRIFLRDIFRCLRTAYFNGHSIYSAFMSTNTTNNPNGSPSLPDSMDLLEFCQNLLSSERLTNECGNSRFINNENNFRKNYVDNIISLITDLQLVSVIRPTVKELLKAKYERDKKNVDIDCLRGHYTTLRQIRFYTCKWLKNIYRYLDSSVKDDEMSWYLRHILFLNITRNSEFTYAANDDSYNMGEVWANETDKPILYKGLTEIPLSEKQIQTLLGLGFDRNLCFRPLEIVEMLSELIIRASACSTSAILAMSINRSGESLISNMFACCCYDVSNEIDATSLKEPTTNETAESNESPINLAKLLAFKSVFWKVCQSLVIIASHCPETCGNLLWNNYPTINNLMHAVITNNFDNMKSDRDILETENVLIDKDHKAILKLENLIMKNVSNNDTATVITPVDSRTSRLIDLLMYNMPQGPIRQPPVPIIESMKHIFDTLRISDRLSQSRNPDFLLEIVRGDGNSSDNDSGSHHQQQKNRKWIIELVKKTSNENINCLPLLCLTEFVFSDFCDNFQTHRNIMNATGFSSGGIVIGAGGYGDKDNSCLNLIVNMIRYNIVEYIKKLKSNGDSTETNMSDTNNGDTNLCSTGNSESSNKRGLISALSLSVFRRLSDPITFVRKVARECLYVIFQKPDTGLMQMKSTKDFSNSLQQLKQLVTKFSINNIIDSMKLTIKYETDIDLLVTYLEWLHSITIQHHKVNTQPTWFVNIIESLSYLLLNRPIICEKIGDSEEYHERASQYFVDIIERYLVQIADNDGVMLNRVFSSVIFLMSWVIEKFGERLFKIMIVNKSVGKKKKALEYWIFKEWPMEKREGVVAEDIVPQWLIDVSVRSRSVKLMWAILDYQVRFQNRLNHSVKSILLQNDDIVIAWCQFMNRCLQDKDYQSLVEQWIENSNYDFSKFITRRGNVISGELRDLLELKYKDSMDINDNKESSTNGSSNVESIEIIVGKIKRGKSSRMEVDKKTNIWSDILENRSDVESNVSIAIQRIKNNQFDDADVDSMIALLKTSASNVKAGTSIIERTDYRLMPLISCLFNKSNNKIKAVIKENIYDNCQFIKRIVNTDEDGDIVDDDKEPGEIDMKMDVDEVNTDDNPINVRGLIQKLNNFNGDDGVEVGRHIDDLMTLGLNQSMAILQLIFGVRGGPSTKLSNHINRDMFMSYLINSLSCVGLRQLVHTLLNMNSIYSTDKTNTSSAVMFEPSRILDFITAIVCAPVNNVVPHPVNSNLSAMYPIQFSVDQLNHLLSIVLLEIELTTYKIDESKFTQLVYQLNKRCQQLVSPCIMASSISNSEKSELFNGFLDSNKGHYLIDKIACSLYSTFPGFIAKRWRIIGGNPNLASCRMLDLRRIGGRIIEAFGCPDKSTQELAMQAGRSLASRHSNLCGGLVAQMSAVAEGAQESLQLHESNKRKRGQNALLGLARVVEQLPSPTSENDRNSWNSLMICLREVVTYIDSSNNSSDASMVSTKLKQVLSKFDDSATGNSSIQWSVNPRTQLDMLLNYRHKHGSHNVSISTAIQELDEMSRRDPSCCGLMAGELRHLLLSLHHLSGHSYQQLLRIICRYLVQFPQHSAAFFKHTITAGLSTSSTSYWSVSFADKASTAISQTAMFAPDEVPKCLILLSRSLIGGRCKYIETMDIIEDVCENLSLERFLDSSVATAILDLKANSSNNSNNHHGNQQYHNNRRDGGNNKKRNNPHNHYDGNHNENKFKRSRANFT